MYVAIDGDDSGRKFTACYINNDETGLCQVVGKLEQATEKIAELLRLDGYRIIFCAADGVTAAIDSQKIEFSETFERIRKASPSGFTFSAGIGSTLREAYIALLNAKCSGKNAFCLFSDIGNGVTANL